MKERVKKEGGKGKSRERRDGNDGNTQRKGKQETVKSRRKLMQTRGMGGEDAEK